MKQPQHTELLGLSLQQLTDVVEGFAQASYRARQLFDGLYRQRWPALERFSNLPQSFRQQLGDAGFCVGLPEIEKKFVSTDGTVRYLLAFADGQSVETVWMPEGDDGEAGDGSAVGDEELADVIRTTNRSSFRPERSIRHSDRTLSVVEGEAEEPAVLSRRDRSPSPSSFRPEAASAGAEEPVVSSSRKERSPSPSSFRPERSEVEEPAFSSSQQESSSAVSSRPKRSEAEGPAFSSPEKNANALSAEGRERKRNRATICVSSQVGCAVDCAFCMTALLGLKRNLSAGEIVGQILAVLNDQRVEMDRDRVNLVFMGQGEPFLNYDNFMQAVRLLVEAVGIPETRMTVSTSGIVPRIADFGAEPVRPKLAVSMNAPSEELRSGIMPITKKWTIEKLMSALRQFPLRNRERLTFEYVLLGGVNDEVQHAHELADLIRGLRAKVNLIALNPGPELPFSTPSDQRVLAFQNVLTRAGIPTFIRRPRGRDIYAACGQLKHTTELVQLGT